MHPSKHAFARTCMRGRESGERRQLADSNHGRGVLFSSEGVSLLAWQCKGIGSA